MRVTTRLITAITLSLCASQVWSLGLGKITVQSYLNENFRASVQILGSNVDDIDRLAVFLAGPEQFKKSGLRRPFVVAMLKFKIIEDASGPREIAITSDRPIKEPVLNFIVELAAPESRVFQEYSVLLDPNPASVGRSSSQAPAETQPVTHQDAVADKPSPAATRKVPFEPAIDRSSASAASEYGPVAQSETLWSIASKIRPDDSISVQQMMLALFRENPEAFADGHIGGLRQGVTLRVPSREMISNIPTDKAFAAIESANRGE